MEEPTKEERKRWWLLCYGITSMDQAIKSCELIAQHCSDNLSPLFLPLSLAVHVFYARPFVRSQAVDSLPTTIVPQDAQGIHNWLRHFRDGVMSHLDATVSETAGTPMNDVIYSISGEYLEFSTKEARARLVSYVHAAEHCQRMISIFHDELIQFHKRFIVCLPKSDGDYLLSLADGSPVFIAGYDRLLESDLTYK